MNMTRRIIKIINETENSKSIILDSFNSNSFKDVYDRSLVSMNIKLFTQSTKSSGGINKVLSLFVCMYFDKLNSKGSNST